MSEVITTQARERYREEVRREYASYTGGEDRFDKAAARRWGRPYDTYLRGWLDIDREGRILDLACGRGRLLHFFRERGFDRVKGVDGSPEQVAIARQAAPEVVEAELLGFLEADGGTYDLICALDIIEHLKRDEIVRFLELVQSRLRSGGRLILQTPNGASPFAGAILYGDVTHETFFSPGGLERMLRHAGFEAVEGRECGPVAHGVRSAGRYALWQFLRTGLSLIDLIETGSRGWGLYTRVFLMSGRKP